MAIGMGAWLSGGTGANGASVASGKAGGHGIQGSVMLKMPGFGTSGLGCGNESGVV
ncbi:hypothetical protein BGW80DRAFT_1315219 [Lactifluus volemus]|nr:hypothetical protein BGW80DRAFT_1315219 [Lactifluus volemus]